MYEATDKNNMVTIKLLHIIEIVLWDAYPRGIPGFKMGIGPLYLYASVKGDWNWMVSRNNRTKNGPCRCLDGGVKEPYEMPMSWSRP